MEIPGSKTMEIPDLRAWAPLYHAYHVRNHVKTSRPHPDLLAPVLNSENERAGDNLLQIKGLKAVDEWLREEP